MPRAEAWLDDQPETVATAVEDWLASLMADGPPPLYELIEVVPDYEYRHWIERAGVVAAIFVLTHERRILVSGFS